MASYRRRGAHAAARKPATPDVSVKRDPQPAVGGHAPRSGGAGGVVSGLRSRSRQLKLGAAGLACCPPGGRRRHRNRQRRAVGRADRADLPAGLGAGPVQGGGRADHGRARAGDHRAAHRLPAAGRGRLLPVDGADHPAFRGTATAQFQASVDLGQDGAAWDYQGHFTLRKVAGRWKVVWSPAVIHPGLRQGLRLAVVTRMPRRAHVLDAGGGSLIRPSAALIAQVRPGQLKQPGGHRQRLRQGHRAGRGAGAQRDPRRTAVGAADPADPAAGRLTTSCAASSTGCPG